ncbi:hypothetical protein MCOR07_003720 [Pyricularia oryzae]|uniref:Uncharacterized protein n=1 Tax=Pyricularia grisea TaxID=148305 RepID=A0ABQ8NGJ5_PYRGI|nr:hypothetical protein MCOR33_006737 [Pyricularia grisea]KAI6308989.1 hypothetical protein MCOR29_009065 [Pyricularia oryzae]KAI6390426.1 hypothetical protein MCOR23_009555 [Pyricularia oryzae]KAI6543391.1 hypothetical protein MCOR05_003226 [Pyricularia oryzae]KAI6623795.1 hypothetical protein MCOR07_003720 [Pyricularia oryzae]
MPPGRQNNTERRRIRDDCRKRLADYIFSDSKSNLLTFAFCREDPIFTDGEFFQATRKYVPRYFLRV